VYETKREDELDFVSVKPNFSSKLFFQTFLPNFSLRKKSLIKRNNRKIKKFDQKK